MRLIGISKGHAVTTRAARIHIRIMTASEETAGEAQFSVMLIIIHKLAETP